MLNCLGSQADPQENIHFYLEQVNGRVAFVNNYFVIKTYVFVSDKLVTNCYNTGMVWIQREC